jgi:hypothetical protein
MAQWVDYLTSSKAMPLVDGLACAIFAAFILTAIATRRISLGSAVSRITRSENPKAYWAVLIVYGVIVAWTGITAAMGVLAR